MANDLRIDTKGLRTSMGWTQDQLGEYLGVDRSTVSRIENGAEIAGPVQRLLQLLIEKKERGPAGEPRSSESGAAA